MLAVNHYSLHYIQECQKRVDRLLECYRILVKTPADSKARAAFEAEFYNCLIIMLDAMFMNRLQSKAHAGTPLHEVRELTSSMLNNEDILQRDTREGETPVLGFRPGATIRLNEEQFIKLAKAYFTEIENQFFLKA